MMVRKLKSYQFRGRGAVKAPETTIDWDKVLDGGVYRLQGGVDYAGEARDMVSRAHSAARKRGLKVRVNTENSVVIEAVQKGGK
jgi:hypothetical protein